MAGGSKSWVGIVAALQVQPQLEDSTKMKLPTLIATHRL